MFLLPVPRLSALTTCGGFMGPPSITVGIYSLVQGPQLVWVFIRLLSVPMPCLLSVAWPEGIYYSVLFRMRQVYAMWTRPVTLSGL